MRISPFVPRLAAICLAATASAAYAQTAIQLFPPVNVRASTAGASYSSPDNFNSTILNLTCPSSQIIAKISSTTDGTGNVLVDNWINFSTGGTPQNVCTGGVSGSGEQSCFTTTYENEAASLVGTDPTAIAGTGGVKWLDVSGLLSAGPVQATITTVDAGGYLASSSLYLYTNCTSQGVTGPGNISGNPISSSPTSQQLTQSFPFNPTTNQQVQFTYDLSQAQNNGLSIVGGTIPSVTDLPLDSTTFQTQYLNGTSFATANCLVHSGELTSTGAAACKLYTLTCQQGTDSEQSGALCPVSSQPNEIFQESFDGPSFSLSDHQGVGLLEAQDGWGGQSCTFSEASGLEDELCPQNVLTNFSGPGLYTSGGRGQNPNSTFISVAPVLEDVTSYTVPGIGPGNWTNNPSPTVKFVVTPPTSTTNNFVAAPILNLTYGVSGSADVPQPGPPVPGDTIVPDTTGCPTPGSQNPPPATVFTVPTQTLSLNQGDGQYVVHYVAQDCAGTEELKFTNGGGSWSTSFYTFPINLDTVPPQVATGPTLSPPPSTIGGVPNAYLVGTAVTASYSCTDAASGVVKCGTQTYPTGTANTGTLTSTVSTSTTGAQSFTVTVADAAGNVGNPASVPYTVVSPPANLSILKLAAASVKQNSQLVYLLTVGDGGKQTASSVVISDPLPVGVTFVKAAALQLVCTNGKCSNPASCSYASTTRTVSCTTPSVSLLTPVVATVTVQVTAAVGTKITNTATVTSSNPQGSGKPQSSATTTVTK